MKIPITDKYTFDYNHDDPDDLDRVRREAVDVITVLMKTYAAPRGVVLEIRQFTEVAYPAIEVTDIFAGTPGQGSGTEVMQELIRLAEDVHIDIFLRPASPRARDFFLGLGFEKDHRHFAHLVRYCSPPEYLIEGAISPPVSRESAPGSKFRI